jgi:hypothetical protein
LLLFPLNTGLLQVARTSNLKVQHKISPQDVHWNLPGTTMPQKSSIVQSMLASQFLFTCHSIALGPSKQINVDSRIHAKKN